MIPLSVAVSVGNGAMSEIMKLDLTLSTWTRCSAPHAYGARPLGHDEGGAELGTAIIAIIALQGSMEERGRTLIALRISRGIYTALSLEISTVIKQPNLTQHIHSGLRFFRCRHQWCSSLQRTEISPACRPPNNDGTSYLLGSPLDTPLILRRPFRSLSNPPFDPNLSHPVGSLRPPP